MSAITALDAGENAVKLLVEELEDEPLLSTREVPVIHRNIQDESPTLADCNITPDAMGFDPEQSGDA